jgi:hypothetical protein
VRLRRRLVAGLALLGVAACGLPDSVRQQAEAIETRLAAQEQFIAEKSQQLERFRSNSDYAFLRPYLEREAWADRFAQATEELAHAREVFDSEIAPRLAEDRPEDEGIVVQQTARARKSIERAAELARQPAQRAAFLTDARDRAPELVREGAAALAHAQGLAVGLAGEVSRASRDYAAKAEDLAGRLAHVEQRTREAADAQAIVRRQQAAGDGADWALLADSAASVSSAAGKVSKADPEIRGRIAELYRSYSKTLVDMKEVATVEIGRTSWNESYDFPRESELSFVVEVSPEDLEVLEAWGTAPIANLTSFFGRSSLKVNIDTRLWKSLAIDPMARFPRGDNAAEFWLGESDAKYFHRYAVVEGDESKQTDWQEVDEALYEEHYDDLGMDILAKPYGIYEEEALKEAAPPGLAYVGNPKYGEWKNDEQGRRHWSWGQSFLFYYLIFGGSRHHYYYNDWNHWNRGYRGRSGWYGRNPDRAAYGTYGSRTRNSGRYAASGFARGGGFRRADRSVRGAGPRGRGGGPGGGGK